MFFKSKNNNQVEPILVLEIESGSVACALVLINSSEQACPIVKYYTRKSFSYDVQNAGENSRDFFNLLFSTVEKATAEVFKQIKKEERPKQIHCFSGSPIYLSQVQHIHLKEAKAFKVTRDLVSELVDEQLSNLEKKFTVGNPALGADDIDIVESKLMKIYLDGYEVNYPYKLRAKELDLVHFSSLVSGRVTKRIESILAGFYPDITLRWHSTAFALFYGININPKSLNNFIIVSSGGLNTEIIVIKDRMIDQVVSIPFGERTITQILQQKLNRTETELDDLLPLGTLEPHLDEIKKIWRNNFDTAIDNLTINAFLPKSILVVGHGAWSKVISKWMDNETMSSEYFGDKCQYLDKNDAVEDIHLMAEVIFCDTLIKQGQSL